MNIFNIDFPKHIRQETPVVLRKMRQMAWLQALGFPAVYVYQMFLRNRKANLYRLKITSQVVYLERLLNDRYDISARRIRIKNSFRLDPVYIYLEMELKPVHIYPASTNNPVYIYTTAETNIEPTDFFVSVPSDLIFNEQEMRGLLNAYALPSKSFSIIRI